MSRYLCRYFRGNDRARMYFREQKGCLSWIILLSFQIVNYYMQIYFSGRSNENSPQTSPAAETENQNPETLPEKLESVKIEESGKEAETPIVEIEETTEKEKDKKEKEINFNNIVFPIPERKLSSPKFGNNFNVQHEMVSTLLHYVIFYVNSFYGNIRL